MARFKVQKIVHTRITYNVEARDADQAIQFAKAAEMKEHEYETEKVGETPWQANIEAQEEKAQGV